MTNKFSFLIISKNFDKRCESLIKNLLEEYEKDPFCEKIVCVVANDKRSEKKSKKLLIIKERVRLGKWNAIRIGLKMINSGIIILLTGDIRLPTKTIKKIKKYIKMLSKNEEIGGIVGKILADKNSRIYKFSKHIWNLHDLLCQVQPKGTEIFLFKNIIKRFPKVSADEVFIEYVLTQVNKKKIVYASDLIGYTSSPYSLKHFFSQRERIFLGHLDIKKRYGYSTSSLNFFLLSRIYLNYIVSLKDSREIIVALLLLLIEVVARIKGMIKFLLQKIPYKW